MRFAAVDRGFVRAAIANGAHVPELGIWTLLYLYAAEIELGD